MIEDDKAMKIVKPIVIALGVIFVAVILAMMFGIAESIFKILRFT